MSKVRNSDSDQSFGNSGLNSSIAHLFFDESSKLTTTDVFCESQLRNSIKTAPNNIFSTFNAFILLNLIIDRV